MEGRGRQGPNSGAMPTPRKILLSLVLLSSVFTDTDAAGANTNSHHVVRVQALQAMHEGDDQACSSKENEGSGLKIVHRHGPCSPLRDQQKASHLQILEQDQSRVNWLQSQVQQPTQVNAEGVSLPSQLGTSLSTGGYIVTIGIGTPKTDMTVFLDTGSSLTWIQCQPCYDSCYRQQDLIFNPAQSTSHLNVSCNSADCRDLAAIGLPNGCSSSACNYSIMYGDGSNSQGFLVQDTLTLTASEVFPDFQFGCGHDNKGLFGRTSGLLGLGRGKISMVSQTASKFGRVFSYYLPSTRSSTGYLKFGADAIPPGVRFTPLLNKQDNPVFYFVDMIGISVGGHALPISASNFSSGPGTIIDSGTVITRLPQAAYEVLRSAFRQAMSSYKMAETPISLFDTCYNFSGAETVSIPKIVLTFREGVDVNVDASGILVMLRDLVGCLAFAGNDGMGGVGIIGSSQQRELAVVYDVDGGRLGFSTQVGPAATSINTGSNTKKQSHAVILMIN